MTKTILTHGFGAALIAFALSATPALAVGSNGSFELGSVPGAFTTITAPNTTDITDWSVDTGSVDYIGSYWLASNLERSIDLNGNEKASISQTFPTTIGTNYKVTFDLSGNPDGGPSAKVVQVAATGGVPTDFTYDTAAMGNTLADMRWAPQSYTFTASGPSTILTFASQIEGAYGPALDTVAIAPQCNEAAVHTIVSDTTTLNSTDSLSAVLAWVHPYWNAFIPGASWIWSTNPTVTIANTDVAKTFTKSFTIVGTPTSGTLAVAADNSYEVKVNGNPILVTFDQNNFRSDTQDSYDVSAYLVSGYNTIEVTVTNWGEGQSTDPFENPAGLMFGLTYTENECRVPAKGTLTVTKVVAGNDAYQPKDFPLFVDDSPVQSGVSNVFVAGQHIVQEAGNAHFMPSYSGDCSLDEVGMKALPNIQDLQTKSYYLQLAIINSPGDAAGNATKQAAIHDINEKIEALQRSLQAAVMVPADGAAQCTITNTFVPPPPTTGSIKIIKNTIGGDGTFNFTGISSGTSVTTVSGVGSATIDGLAVGTYTAVEAAQVGWNLTSSNCTNVQVYAGETATCTVINTKQSSISGMKYNDLNRNGKRDVGEPGLQGWLMRLVGPNKTVIATATTDVTGVYTFNDIAPGTYKVRETRQKGWKRMSKNPKAIIITTGSVVTDVNFGNAQKLKREVEDTDKDDNREDQSGSYVSNHDRSNYSRDEGKSERNR